MTPQTVLSGLLITDPGANGVLTLNYSSVNGTINNSKLTSINTSLASALCWSTYSPTIGNYYVIAAASATIVELNLNLNSNASPVGIIAYYPIQNNTGALEATVVSLAGTDYLYVLGTTAHIISGYRLNSAGNATANGIVIAQQNNTANIPKLAGIAAFVQTRSSSSSSSTSTPSSTTKSSAGSATVSITTVTIYMLVSFFYFWRNK